MANQHRSHLSAIHTHSYERREDFTSSMGDRTLTRPIDMNSIFYLKRNK